MEIHSEPTLFFELINSFYDNIFPEEGMYGLISIATPITACETIQKISRQTIVIVKRGKCKFIDKMRNVQHAGGSAMIIIDTDSNTKPSSTLLSTIEYYKDIYIPSFILPLKYKKSLYKYIQNNDQPEVILKYYTQHINFDLINSPLFLKQIVKKVNSSYIYKKEGNEITYFVSLRSQ